MNGIVELKLFDNTGKLKKHIHKHNTVTQLGKFAALSKGVANLFDYCQLAGAGVQKIADTGSFSSTSSPSGPQKQSTAVVKCVLTSKSAADFAYHTQIALTDAETIGYCSSEVATSADAKQGIRVTARNDNMDMIVANGNRQAARYSWTGIEGNLNTVAMFIPPIAIEHCVDSYETSDTSPASDPFEGLLFAGDAGITGEKMGIGKYKDIILNMSDLTLGDAITGTSDLPAPQYARCGFKFGDYIITFAPGKGYWNGTSVYYSGQQKVSVYNTTNDTYYEQNLIDSSSSIYGFFVKSNTLYVVVAGNAYSCAITDSAITLTAVTTSSFVDSSWLTQYSSEAAWAFIPVQQGNEYYTYCLVLNQDNNSANCYIMPDMLLTADNKYIAPFFCGRQTAYKSIGGFSQAYNIERAGIYLNAIYELFATTNYAYKPIGLYVTPAGQWGNLFSYFDLEETWEINASDTLQLTYYYKLEDRQ